MFRIDLYVAKNGETKKIRVVRDDDTLYIKEDGIPLKRFNGINGDSSLEHIKLKEFLNGLFDFKLQLESKGELKTAPIEAMFLPYYVSQSVGWVYLRKSISGFEYYKNFKEDYLDYYLGLDPAQDRVKKHSLEKQLRDKESEIAVISSLEVKNEELALTKLVDEEFITTSNQYVAGFSEKHNGLTAEENEYVVRCNELAYLQERKSVLQRVANNHKSQRPQHDNCPTCSQALPFGISETYRYLQEENDTKYELDTIKSKIKDVQYKINSLQNSIADKRQSISNEYATLNKYYNSNISYDMWLKNKANLQLVSKLHEKVGQLVAEQNELLDKLGKFKTDVEIEKERIARGKAFTKLFTGYLTELKVKQPTELRYLQLYLISTLPYQGVELHKTIMAYHFAFNGIVAQTENIHRFPFMLDAIFKEDLDDENRKAIPEFISKNRPKDTQVIFSIAQAKGQVSNAAYYNKTYFANDAKLKEVSDGTRERNLLSVYNNELP